MEATFTIEFHIPKKRIHALLFAAWLIGIHDHPRVLACVEKMIHRSVRTFVLH